MSADVALPSRMQRLPRNKVGYVVPWFVAWIDGEPDFRVIEPGKLDDARAFDLCWLCGQPRGRYATFVIGPMCAVNRVSAEPPSHKECATYAARVCPFLSTPNMVRRPNNLPEGHVAPPGEVIARNPGVALVWTSRNFTTFDAGNGLLYDVGDPTEVAWYAQGRPATREEVIASITSGLPILTETAESEGPEAVNLLKAMLARAMTIVLAT